MPEPIASSRPGMGAVPFDGGVTFRVWAPHAQGVSVTGSFCAWDAAGEPLAPEDGGSWSADVAAARPGDEYRLLVRAGEERSRLDPRARQLTSSVGNAVVYDPDAFDWGGWRVPHSGLERPGHLRAARGHLQRRHARSARHARGRAPTPRLPAGAGHRSYPADAALRVRRRPLVGLQPGVPVRGGVVLRPPRRPQGARPGRPRSRHRRARRRRVQPPGPVRPGHLALRWLVGERQGRHLLLPGRPLRHPMGRHPARLRPSRGARLPARQRHDLARGVPHRRTALGRHRVHQLDQRRRVGRPGPHRGRLGAHGGHQRRGRRALRRPADDRRGPAQ